MKYSSFDELEEMEKFNHTNVDRRNSTTFSYSDCQTSQTITSLENFFICYSFFYNQSPSQSIAQIFLFVGTILVNFLVITLLYVRPIKISIFDQILIGYCLVNGITGIVDIPFYHVWNIFGYWPFGKIPSMLWVSYLIIINCIMNCSDLF
jgi:hypothetical protein